jgi:NAD(P)-dependent dehydrogenase (short-subunit alcohol dehydrogenase family)
VTERDFEARCSLDGKVALVTGGAGILGSEFCRGLLQRGAQVVLADIDGAAADLAAQPLADVHGGRVLAVACDVSDPDSVAALVQAGVERFGAIDVLLNNAASKSTDLTAFFAPFEKYSLDQWRQVMAVNVDGVFLVAQAVGRQMVTQGAGGSIVNVSSVYGVVSSDNRIYEGSSYLGRQINNPAVYSTSKAAVIGLTRWLATYWAEHGIRVNAIAPGGVESGQNDAFRARYAARVPMGRMAQRHEVVGAGLFLASEASSYVTGQILVVDGGLTAW